MFRPCEGRPPDGSSTWATSPSPRILCAMFGSVILAAVVATGGLRVETKTPDALCPDVRQVREAVRARLGEIEGQGQWLASYTLVHRPEGLAPGDVGDVVRVELRDPSGK